MADVRAISNAPRSWIELWVQPKTRHLLGGVSHRDPVDHRLELSLDHHSQLRACLVLLPHTALSFTVGRTTFSE